MSGVGKFLELGLKSVLEEAVDAAPAKMAAEHVPAFLKSKGVTSDEFKFSGVGPRIPAEGQVSKDTLTELVKGREDIFDVVTQRRPTKAELETLPKRELSKMQPLYETIHVRKASPNYREHILTFKKKGEENQVTLSTHFPDVPNYIGHARTDDYATKDGKRVRQILELQSDTAARMQRGPDKLTYDMLGAPAIKEREAFSQLDILAVVNGKADDKLAQLLGVELDSALFKRAKHDIDQAYVHAGKHGALAKVQEHMYAAAEQPLVKNIYKKLIEQQVLLAQKEGISTIEIPLNGPGLAPLQRGGSQKIYDTVIKSEVEKLAKQNGWKLSYDKANNALYGGTITKPSTDFMVSKILDIPEKDIVANIAATEAKVAAGKATFADIIDDSPVAYANALVEYVVGQGKEILKDIYVPKDVAKAAEDLVKAGASNLDKALSEGQKAAYNVVSTWYKGLDNVNIRLGDYTKMVLDMSDDAGNIKVPAKPFTLYSSPVAGAFLAYQVIAAGGKDAQVNARLAEEGYSEDEMTAIKKDAEFIARAYAQGIPENRVRAFLEQDEVEVADVQKHNPTPAVKPGDYYYKDEKDTPTSPFLPTTQQQFAKEGQNLRERQIREKRLWARDALAQQETMPIAELSAALRVVYPDLSAPSTMLMAFGGNEDSARVMYENAANAQRHIQQAFAERGINVTWSDDAGGFVDENGTPIDEGFWSSVYKDLSNSKWSIGLGIAGGVQGGRVASQAASGFGPVGKLVAGALGVVGGGALGSSAGSQVDYLKAAVKTGEALNGQVMFRKSLTEAEWSALGDLAGATLFKVAASSGVGAKRILDMLRAKDVEGALQATKEFLHVSDDELEDIAKGYKRVTAIPGAGDKQQQIVAAVLTKPGGEVIVEAAANQKGSVGSAVLKSVNDRAQSLLTNVDNIKDQNAAVKILDDLKGYVDDVNRNYELVKQQAINSTKAGEYRFGFDTVTILPVLEDAVKGIHDPTVQARFINKMQHIKQLTQTRSYADLIELRKIVNSMLSNVSVQNARGISDLRKSLQAIDDEIVKGAPKALDNPEQWLKDWKQANKLYSEKAQLEENALYRALTAPGVSPKTVARALYRYSTSMDSTFVQVMSKLPKQTRLAAESEIFDALANKYTKGDIGGLRATNFPALAEELKQIPFTSPEARKLQIATLKMADVFQNDVALAQVSGGIKTPQFQSYLTADPVIRAKFALASGVFKKVKEMVPGEMQRNLALVNILTEVLDKPMNAKLLDDLVKEAGDRVDLTEQVRALSAAAAKQAADQADQGAPRVAVFGDGKIQSTKPVVGNATRGESIPMHRIASVEDVRIIAAAEGVNPADIKAVDTMLRMRGYKAVQVGTNKIRRIDQ